ncbi:SMI1/KNR4 family protein [Methylobacterium sp. E-045]|uniref:SMI1/KNR4 family protein n=1 Tax=Methylobacterium sp. E-045 TaxID=2836575 RepID=UPI001FBB8DEE|nr:SMI1/KNR4 family protein [Methylobacterium sp. E-045]MCJ2131332.1 SMI1/KNR4 family protein [Methylobacterium sp. E-045]
MTPNELAAIIDGQTALVPDSAEIEAFEALIGARLPDDYRAFLALTRGGRLRGRVVFSLVGEEIGAERVGCVAGLCGEEDCSLQERHRTASDCDIPESLLSIMTDGGGNDIALVLRPDRLGEVFFLDHEVSGGEGRPTLEDAEGKDWGYAIRFASSFSEMVAGFRIA